MCCLNTSRDSPVIKAAVHHRKSKVLNTLLLKNQLAGGFTLPQNLVLHA